jgi:hypothetical protein
VAARATATRGALTGTAPPSPLSFASLASRWQ